jgi:hypothetical protein
MAIHKHNESQRKEVEILRVLSEFNQPIGSTILQRELMRRGFPLDDRTIRYHLKILEEKGFVEGRGRNGRIITGEGLEELSRALAYQRVGSILTRYLTLAYSVTYDPTSNSGKVVANVSIVGNRILDKVFSIVRSLYKAKLLPAPYIKILHGEGQYGSIFIPKGKIAIFTVCNLTLDGLLIRSGIPILLRYGGLVQFVNYKPLRFVELLSYEGTTLPPLELLTHQRLTSIMSFLRSGTGVLPANFREAPAEARDETINIFEELKVKGWGGIIAVGQPNESVLGIPVAMDRFGISMIGGLTPEAALKESGVSIKTFAPHCLIPLEDMEKIS